jgi:hypothetical protein
VQTIPVLPSRSFDRTILTYAGFGLETALRRSDPDGYLVLRRSEFELHFFAHPMLDPAANDAQVFIRCHTAAELSTLWQALSERKLPDRGIPRLSKPEFKPWGLLEFAFVDTDGNLLRIGADQAR